MNEEVRILIVDDEEDILEFLKYNLEQEKYVVQVATDGAKALSMMGSFKPHLVILDVMMPGMDGIEVCERIRANEDYSKTLIAFLTARNESFTQITALETGGDDYINKPIKPNVLKSRIKALLRRHPSLDGSEASVKSSKFGKLEINYEQFKVSIDGKEIPLAKKEFELLILLASKPGKVFKRNEILNKIWGEDVIVGARTIDVHIRKLREKIGDDYIYTFKGVGYKFEFV